MAMLKKFRNNSIIQRKKDEAFYSLVAQEMASGIVYEGLWIKAFELADGDEKKQLSEYIRLRVQSLKDDVSLIADHQEPRQGLRHKRDIEGFIALLNGDVLIEEVENYFSGMSADEVVRFINTSDACEDYPLHIAIKKGRVDIAEWLLRAGSKPTVRNYWGLSPLDNAVIDQNQDAIDILAKYSN